MPQHVVIIGGGIIGSATAYYLAQLAQIRSLASLQITILEGSSIAAGASGKAGGLLARDWHGPSTSSLAALSYNLHASLAAEHSGETRWGYRKLDTLSVSADLSPSSRSRKSHKPKQDELSGWLNKEVLLDTSVLGTKESTAQAHPALLTRALVELAQQKSVKVVYGTATGLSRSAEGELIVKAILRDGGAEIALVATQVVVAAGPWTGQLIKQLGLRGGRAAEITGSRAHSVVLRTADSRPLPAQALFTSIKEAGRGGTHEPEIYNRPDGTAYACGPTDSAPLPRTAADVEVDPAAIASIVSQVGALAPDYLAVNEGDHSATIETTQACYLPVGSGDPVIGALAGEKGVFVASGHSCWGITNGPGTGLCLAELILDGKVSSADISDLAP